MIMEGIPTLKAEEKCNVKCEDDFYMDKHTVSEKLFDTQVEGKYKYTMEFTLLVHGGHAVYIVHRRA